MADAPHDALFKGIFSQPVHAAGLLATFVPPAFAARVDWSTLARMPGSFVDAQLQQRHSDLLFSVDVGGGASALLYVLVEHQSKPDPRMALRLLGYTLRIWETWEREHPGAHALPAVLPIVVHHGRGGWTSARALSELYDLDADALAALAPHLPELRFVLDDLATVPTELLERREMTDLGRLALLFLKRMKISPDVAAEVVRWMDMLARVLRGPQGRQAIDLLVNYTLDARDEEPEGLLAALEEHLGREGREAYMSAAQKLRDEGRVEGQAELLLCQIEKRFGTPAPAISSRVRGASTAEIRAWAERILTAGSLSDLFGED